MHCTFLENPSMSTIGFPKLFDYIGKERSQSVYSVLVLDTRDCIQWLILYALTSGNVNIDGIIRTNYGSVTVGNHEWNFGHSASNANRKALQSHVVLIVCANVFNSVSGEEIQYPDYLVKIVDDVRIEIFGLATSHINETTSWKNIRSVTF